jgi:hypothetical protein
MESLHHEVYYSSFRYNIFIEIILEISLFNEKLLLLMSHDTQYSFIALSKIFECLTNSN